MVPHYRSHTTPKKYRNIATALPFFFSSVPRPPLVFFSILESGQLWYALGGIGIMFRNAGDSNAVNHLLSVTGNRHFHR